MIAIETRERFTRKSWPCPTFLLRCRIMILTTIWPYPKSVAKSNWTFRTIPQQAKRSQFSSAVSSMTSTHFLDYRLISSTKKEWVATSSLSKPEEEFPQRPDSPPEIIRIFRKMCGVGTLNPLEKFSGASERNGESLSSVDLLSEPQECCHGVVSQLVQIVCPTIDSESKRRISDKVARACLAPPGMTEEELTSMILMEWNELSLWCEIVSSFLLYDSQFILLKTILFSFPIVIILFVYLVVVFAFVL